MIQNELRINNWVYDTSDATKIDQRVRLDEDYLEVLFAARDYGKLQPITLTEEILLKCGFVTSNIEFAGVKVSMEHKDGIYSVNLMNDGTYQFGLPYEDFCTDVKSLHQVQNLFYCLSGQELNVEL